MSLDEPSEGSNTCETLRPLPQAALRAIQMEGPKCAGVFLLHTRLLPLRVNSHLKYEQAFKHFHGPTARDLNTLILDMNGGPSVSSLSSACIKNVMPSLTSEDAPMAPSQPSFPSSSTGHRRSARSNRVEYV